MNRHPFAWGSAVFGILFAAVAAVWTARELDLLDAGTAGVVAAGTLIVLGLLGVVATVAIARRPTRPAVPPPPAAPDDHVGERVEEDADRETAEEVTDGPPTAPQQR